MRAQHCTRDNPPLYTRPTRNKAEQTRLHLCDFFRPLHGSGRCRASSVSVHTGTIRRGWQPRVVVPASRERQLATLVRVCVRWTAERAGRRPLGSEPNGLGLSRIRNRAGALSLVGRRKPRLSIQCTNRVQVSVTPHASRCRKWHRLPSNLTAAPRQLRVLRKNVLSASGPGIKERDSASGKII